MDDAEIRKTLGTRNGVFLGAGLGLIFGAALGNPAVGLVLGAGLGVVLGRFVKRP